MLETPVTREGAGKSERIVVSTCPPISVPPILRIRCRARAILFLFHYWLSFSLLVHLERLGTLIAPTPSPRPPFPTIGCQSGSVTGASLTTVVMPRT
jgi:hypothetical protein